MAQSPFGKVNPFAQLRAYPFNFVLSEAEWGRLAHVCPRTSHGRPLSRNRASGGASPNISIGIILANGGLSAASKQLTIDFGPRMWFLRVKLGTM